MSEPKQDYLGDGLYASYDGWALTLRAPREGGDHYVVLEDIVFAELMRFCNSLGDNRFKPRVP